MKYICDKVKTLHCKGSNKLNKCPHSIPHKVNEYDVGDDCTECDECFKGGKSIKVKCIEYHE